MNVDIPEYDNKHCRGCVGYINTDKDILIQIDYDQPNNIEIRVCSYAKYNKEGYCPCSSCIVKPMCVDPCEDYNLFRFNVGEVGI